jgi:hypothetical protein
MRLHSTWKTHIKIREPSEASKCCLRLPMKGQGRSLERERRKSGCPRWVIGGARGKEEEDEVIQMV